MGRTGGGAGGYAAADGPMPPRDYGRGPDHRREGGGWRTGRMLSRDPVYGREPPHSALAGQAPQVSAEPQRPGSQQAGGEEIRERSGEPLMVEGREVAPYPYADEDWPNMVPQGNFVASAPTAAPQPPSEPTASARAQAATDDGEPYPHAEDDWPSPEAEAEAAVEAERPLGIPAAFLGDEPTVPTVSKSVVRDGGERGAQVTRPAWREQGRA